MSTEPVLYAREGAVAILTLNRPQLRNALSDPDMIESLVETLGRIQSDSGVHVAILTGQGSAFSSGGNLKQMGASATERPPTATRIYYDTGIQRIPRAFDALEVPVIAAVNGPAIGAGCDLACMCDIRIAAESASFAESFVKVGLIPGDGGAWLLQRVVGFSRASEMTYTGDAITAADAMAWGLVSRVVPDVELMASARALAVRIAANPPQVVRMSKRLMREARTSSLESVLQLSATMQSLAHTTTDHVEAVQAMLEKRPPRFSGR